MSIIYDALKKVERSKKNSPGPKAPEEDKSKVKSYLVYVLIGLVGFVLAGAIFRFATMSLRGKELAPIKVPAVASPKPRPEKKAVSENKEVPAASTESGRQGPAPSAGEQVTAPARRMTLNGVFFSEDEGYALIDNKVVKVGDAIEGAQVIKIDIDGVELEAGGETFRLETK